MKVVLPMAGRGSRFANQGVTTPKPLIEIAGRPMVWWALQSLKELAFEQIVFIALREHDEQFQLKKTLPTLIPDGIKVDMIFLDNVTEGQLCTVLTADQFIDTEEDVLVASSDTLVLSSLAADIASRPENCAGLISVANMPGDRWSFAGIDAQGNVVKVAEKVRISDHASTGLYYFSSGRTFLRYGRQMVERQERIRGEYYIIPLYQKLIDDGQVIRLSFADEMWDMGTPESLTAFESGYLNRRNP